MVTMRVLEMLSSAICLEASRHLIREMLFCIIVVSVEMKGLERGAFRLNMCVMQRGCGHVTCLSLHFGD